MTQPVKQSPIARLPEFGQSPWYDNLTRQYATGGLRALMARDDIRGVTSNPTIYEKALAAGDDYDDQIGALGRAGIDTKDVLGSQHHRHRERSRLVPPCVRLARGRRRVRVGRGRSRSRAQHRRHREAGGRAVHQGRPAQRDDQDPGHGRVSPRDHRDHRRGNQREHHPDLRVAASRRGDRVVSLGSRATGSAVATSRRSTASRRSSSAASTPRPTAASPRGTRCAARRPSRTRSWPTSSSQARSFSGLAVGGLAAKGAWYSGCSGLRGRPRTLVLADAVRRRAHRPRHGQHTRQASDRRAQTHEGLGRGNGQRRSRRGPGCDGDIGAAGVDFDDVNQHTEGEGVVRSRRASTTPSAPFAKKAARAPVTRRPHDHDGARHGCRSLSAVRRSPTASRVVVARDRGCDSTPERRMDRLRRHTTTCPLKVCHGAASAGRCLTWRSYHAEPERADITDES